VSQSLAVHMGWSSSDLAAAPPSHDSYNVNPRMNKFCWWICRVPPSDELYELFVSFCCNSTSTLFWYENPGLANIPIWYMKHYGISLSLSWDIINTTMGLPHNGISLSLIPINQSIPMICLLLYMNYMRSALKCVQIRKKLTEDLFFRTKWMVGKP